MGVLVVELNFKGMAPRRARFFMFLIVFISFDWWFGKEGVKEYTNKNEIKYEL